MNSFGRIFKISIFGESHGPIVGCVIDGCPAGLHLEEKDLLEDINKRKSGAIATTPRKEDDYPEILSGVYGGVTTGAPITIQFKNKNISPKDYSQFLDTPRPGHADFVATRKYSGFADLRGGGHFSGRLTLPLVAVGVIAKKIVSGCKFTANVTELGGKGNIDEALQEAINNRDSIGGIIECKVEGIPVGLGEPFFDSVESLISHGVFAIPGIKGIEFGNGFKATELTGRENNDMFISKNGDTLTNNSGGINGGITNGNPLFFRVAIKPTASISLPQMTYNFAKDEVEELKIDGRHDLAFVLRVPVIVEAITAIVLADLMIINNLINIVKKGVEK